MHLFRRHKTKDQYWINCTVCKEENMLSKNQYSGEIRPKSLFVTVLLLLLWSMLFLLRIFLRRMVPLHRSTVQQIKLPPFTAHSRTQGVSDVSLPVCSGTFEGHPSTRPSCGIQGSVLLVNGGIWPPACLSCL